MKNYVYVLMLYACVCELSLSQKIFASFMLHKEMKKEEFESCVHEAYCAFYSLKCDINEPIQRYKSTFLYGKFITFTFEILNFSV